MKLVDFLIVGGGVAGTTAAETLRSNDKNCSIMIISDEPYRFYSRILLSKPNFFLEKTPFDQVWLKTEAWYKENMIELIAGKSAVKLDPHKKILTLEGGEEYKYGKLLLSLGGHARRWEVKGANKKGVGYLRNLDEAKEMIAAVKKGKHGIAIGSGFVSFEITELMRKAGMEATVVMREPYYWYPVFDEVSGKIIEKAMEKEGVKMIRESEVKEVIGDKDVAGVLLTNGTKIDCDVVAVGIGLDYNLKWVNDAGVPVSHGIIANEYLQTVNPDIYTAGDCAEFNDVILGERVLLGNWANAQNQGQVAALNMLGKKQPFKLVSFYSAQAFGMNISMVGNIRMDAGKTAIDRGSPETNSYARIILKDGRIVGATLLNRGHELFQIAKMIENGVTVVGKEDHLSDVNFNLSTLSA